MAEIIGGPTPPEFYNLDGCGGGVPVVITIQGIRYVREDCIERHLFITREAEALEKACAWEGVDE